MSIYSYETEDGRTLYVRASWSDRQAQYSTTDVPHRITRHVQGYVCTFARTIRGLVEHGQCRTYATEAAAKRAERRDAEREGAR
jgi:hypothetical protein